MVFANKNKFKLLSKQFVKLKKSVQNNKNFLEFKKQKCENLIKNYKQKLRRYYKFKQLEQNQNLVFRYSKREFLSNLKNNFYKIQKLELLNKNNKKQLKKLELFVTVKPLQLNEKVKKVNVGIITPVVTEDIVAYLLQNVDENVKFSKLYKLIVSEANLIAAWLETEKKLSLSNESKTSFKLPLKWFKKTSELLMLEKYNYKALRIVNIPKKRINNFQKLILMNPCDIIVRKAFYRVLNVVFEGYFEWEKTNKKTFQAYCLRKSDFNQIFKKNINNEYWIKKFKINSIFSSMSYGFRPKKGVHSAIHAIENKWRSNWCASYNISKTFDKTNTATLVKSLQKYVNDIQTVEQIKKMLDMQITYAKLYNKSSVFDVLQDSILSPLLFNIYLHPLDEFMHKIIENAIKKHEKKLTKQNGAKVMRINNKITSPCIYFARFMNDFLLGFFMSKTQIKVIMEDISMFIANNLKLKITQTVLKPVICDKISFLGFDIRMRLVRNSKRSKAKKLEAYKRHKSMVIRRGTQEHEKFLKMVEWLGRKAIANLVNENSAPEKPIEKRIKLEKKFPLLIQQENWFYNKHKFNKKIELALKNRSDNQQYRFKRWIKANQDLINSIEIMELAKIMGKEHTDRLNSIRKDTSKLIEEMIGAKAEKAYVLELRSLKQNLIKIGDDRKLVSKFEILFPKKKILEELKKKYIINSKGMPSAVMSKTILLDFEIINWYTIVAEGLLLYYGCTNNLIELKRFVNWALRYSLFSTLGAKHKKSTKWVIENFGFDPKVILKDKVIARFPSAGWINSRKKKYMDQTFNNKDLWSIINSKYIKLNQRVVMQNKCGLNACENSPERFYNIKDLNQI